MSSISNELDLYFRIHRHNRTTFAIIDYVTHDGELIVATGSANKHPGDAELPSLGADIATARAMDDLSTKLHRRSMNIANHKHRSKKERAKNEQRKRNLTYIETA